MGILLILVSAAAGYCLLKQFTKDNQPIVSLCGAIVIGCLLCGTILYLVDFLLAKNFANYTSGTFILLAALAGFILYSFKHFDIGKQFRADILSLRQDRVALGVLATLVIFASWLNWHSLNTTSNANILVANGAWSDLMYHVSYVRSVALGNNVPIQYPYFAREPIRYHFLFDYFSGKVSQLGLDGVLALNIMSTAGLISLLMLIFEFGRLLFKSTLTGVLGVLFLIFHSSLSVFPWIKANLSKDLLHQVLSKDGWLKWADFEEWGLFNLNVFANQRHFAFGLAVLVFLVIWLIQFTSKSEEDEPVSTDLLGRFKDWLVEYKHLKLPVFWAAIIGCLPFWNALFAAVSVFFLLAFALINYRKRDVFFTLLLAAALASLIIYPQLMLFKAGASALAGYPRFHFGYALDRPSLTGFVLFYFKVFGVKLFLLGAALVVLDRKQRLYSLIFLIPFAIANLFQLSSVLYDNNKLIFASVVFLNCYAAYSIAYLVKRRSRAKIAGAVVLGVLVTLAGVVDFFAVKNLKQAELADQTSSLKWWVIQNTQPQSVFLTNVYIPFADNAISSLSLAGRYLYVVSNCVASSCFVDPRIENARRIYSFEGGVDQVKSLLKNERINYILVDEHVRNNPQLALNERALIENFKVVYKDDSVKVFAAP